MEQHPFYQRLSVQDAEFTPVGDEHEHGIKNWHPKVTGYRLFVVSSTVGFGVFKAITTSRGESSVATHVQWLFGIIGVLIIHFGGLYQSSSPRSLPFFFEKDYADYLWHLLRRYQIPVPHYSTDDPEDLMFVRGELPLTPYRLLVSGVVATAGTLKAALSWKRHHVAMDRIDWSIGVVFSVVSFCVGQYESGPTLAPFFRADCAPAILHVSSLALSVLPRIVVAFLSAKCMTLLVPHLPTMWDPHKQSAGESKFVAVLGRLGATAAVLTLVNMSATLCLLAGFTFYRAILRYTFPLVYRLLRTPPARMLYPLVSILLKTPLWAISPRLLGYVLIHLQGLLFCVIWMSMWWVTLREASPAEDGELWVMLLFGLLSMVGFSCTLLLLGGAFVTCVVLYSLFGPLFDKWTDRDLVRWASYQKDEPFEDWGELAHSLRAKLRNYLGLIAILVALGLMASSNSLWVWLYMRHPQL